MVPAGTEVFNVATPENEQSGEREAINEGATPADPSLLASIGEALTKGSVELSSFAQRATSRERRNTGMMEIAGPPPVLEPQGLLALPSVPLSVQTAQFPGSPLGPPLGSLMIDDFEQQGAAAAAASQWPSRSKGSDNDHKIQMLQKHVADLYREFAAERATNR